MGKRERYEKRLFRILAKAGYFPARMLSLTVEEMCEVPGITVPNIRTLLYLQKKLRKEKLASCGSCGNHCCSED